MNGMHHLQQHAELQAALQSTIARPTAGNVCPVCHKAFDRMYNLKVHFRKHTGETPYTCPVHNCSKQFRWRSSMAHHVRAHHDARETAGVSLRTSNDVQGSKGNTSRAQNSSVGKKPVRPTALIAQAPGIQKPQRKRAPRASKAAKKRECLRSTSELKASVESYAEPDTTPLLTISAEPLKLGDECDSNGAELLFVLPDVLSGDTEILDDADEMCSSVPSTFADDALEDSTDVTLFLISAPDDAANAELEALDRDASLKAAVEATNLPLNEYALM